jgi:hypothetical protein
MKTIKYLKNDYLQLGDKIYKPYSICDLAETKFGEIDLRWILAYNRMV